MQNSLNKLMEMMAKQKDAEETEKNLNISVGGSEVPFSVVEEDDLNTIVEFKENNQEMFDVEKDNGSV